MAHWLLLPEEKVMNNYRKSSINHPLGLFILNTFNGGGGGGRRKTMLSALHKKLESKVEKLKYKN